MVKIVFVPGQKIYSWTVVSRLPDDKKTRSVNLRKRVRLRCDCGTLVTIPSYYLKRKNPKTHCGCKNRGIASNNKLEYRVWYMMNVRCQNPNHVAYKDYGGRGIEVCERWNKANPHGFANFLADMGPRRRINLTLDRIDVNGPYAPTYNGRVQCRWATWDEQNNNKRLNLLPPPEEDESAKDLLPTEALDEDSNDSDSIEEAEDEHEQDEDSSGGAEEQSS